MSIILKNSLFYFQTVSIKNIGLQHIAHFLLDFLITMFYNQRNFVQELFELLKILCSGKHGKLSNVLQCFPKFLIFIGIQKIKFRWECGIIIKSEVKVLYRLWIFRSNFFRWKKTRRGFWMYKSLVQTIWNWRNINFTYSRICLHIMKKMFEKSLWFRF